MNSVILSEVSSLKLKFGPTVESRLKQHEFEINTLAHQVNQYYSYFTDLLYPQQTSSSTKIPYIPTKPAISEPRMIAAY